MVLRDKHRAAEPNCPAMASEQPLKKKQRTQPPDLPCEGAVVYCSEDLALVRGGEDAVDCAAVPAKEPVENFVLFAGNTSGVQSTSEVPNGIHNPHFPFSVQTLDGLNAYNPATDTQIDKCEANENVLFRNFDSFQDQLIKQCLCSVSEDYLKTPFSCRLNISDWPPDKILLFLSNLQLLFDVYLKQNYKGSICAKLMDVCDTLVRNEHDWLGEVVHLANHHSKFVNFLACRVVSSFLIVAKDNIDHEWLQKIMDNVYLFDTFDSLNVSKINFSLDVVKRVVEWKDIDQHPLEDSAYINTSNPLRPSAPDQAGSSRNEDNYQSSSISMSNDNNLQNAFSNLHTTQCDTSTSGDNFLICADQSNCKPQDSLFLNTNNHNALETASQNFISNNITSDSKMNEQNSIYDSNSSDSTAEPCLRPCEIVTVSDSESFDTSHVKCLTIKCLERHWPALIKNIKQLLTRYLNLTTTENCILSFLSLWENIISVKANLSVVDTKPFYMDFQSFVELLRYTNLPPMIYTQLLSLFNEVLCYGSTLALQDMLPEETCTLAHSIVRFVKDFRLLSEVRLRQSRTGFNFVGYDSQMILSYSVESHANDDPNMFNTLTDNNSSVSIDDARDSTMHRTWSLPRSETDKTMLQKMVLLVLKSVAVTVKEMRCDSSDSSIDSTDYNAIQDMQMVERSIRDVLKKLDVFLKTTLDFLPESPFTKILIHLFSDQDDYLIESMVCTLDITVGIVYRNSVFPDLIPMLNPIASFIEFLEVVSHDSDILLDYLVSNETCFLLYLLRFLKYVRRNWSKFVVSCREVGVGPRGIDDTMAVLIRLRIQINRLVVRSLFPYNISPVLRLLELCENLYEGNELS